MIALADCNNFYVSCERVFNPKLKNKPVLVLSNNDGCIIARSNEAKRLGFKMGEPAFKKREHIKNNNVNIYSTNFSLYGDMSNRVMSILADELQQIEIYSIDEAFLKLNGVEKKEAYALKIKQKIHKYTGIPISIGIGKTKTLAKIANMVAKQTKKGVYYIKSNAQIEKILKKTNVSKIWGIGKNRTQQLYSFNIYTAEQFRKKESSWIKKKMSTTMLKTKEELNGRQRFTLQSRPDKKKNICTSRTFYKEIKSINDLEKQIATYAMNCAKKLRKQKSSARAITVFIQTNRFKKQQMNFSKSLFFETPTSDSLEIVKNAIELLLTIYDSNFQYKRAGIIVSKIIPTEKNQINIFDPIDRRKRKKLMIAIDKINEKIGKNKIKIGTQGRSNSWKMKQQNLSPCYTTRWSDIIEAR